MASIRRVTAFIGRWRGGRLIPFAAALLLTTTVHCYSLTLQDTLADWICSDRIERLNLINLLTVVASDGRPDIDDAFFVHCLEQVDVSYSKRIFEIVAGCRLMETYVFTESG